MSPGMSTDIPQLFDRRRRALRRDRAARSGGFRDCDYLHRLVAARIAERLGDTPFPFARAAILGSAGGLYGDAIAGRPGLVEIQEIDQSARLGPPEAPPGAVARRFALGDAERPPLPPSVKDQGLDLIVSGLELHAMDDPLGALIQMRRAMRPNGFLVAALFIGDSLAELRAALAEAEGPDAPARIFPMADLRDLGGLLQRAGFSMPVADVERLTLWHRTPLHLLRELRAMGETNILRAPRPRPLDRAVLTRLMAIYAERFARPDGKVRATVEIAFLTGWRPGPGQPTPKRPGSATARLADALGAPERSAGEKAGR